MTFLKNDSSYKNPSMQHVQNIFICCRYASRNKVYDNIQCRFCIAVTSAAVRIYKCEDEGRRSKQIRKGRVWKCAYLKQPHIFELLAVLVHIITPVNKSFVSDLQPNFRFSKGPVLRSYDWKHNRAGILTF
jgi:hypothetical protein